MAYNETKKTSGIQGMFDPNGNSQLNMIKCKKVSISTPADGTETSISVALPTNAYVKDAILKVITAEATGMTKTVNIGTASGTGGDADGFVAAGSVAATGFVIGAGALVGTVLTGNDAITLTAGSAGFVEFTGELYIFYVEL